MRRLNRDSDKPVQASSVNRDLSGQREVVNVLKLQAYAEVFEVPIGWFFEDGSDELDQASALATRIAALPPTERSLVEGLVERLAKVPT